MNPSDDPTAESTILIRGGLNRTPFDETAEAIFPTSGYVYGSAAEAEASPRTRGEPVRQSEKNTRGSGSAQTAAVSETHPGADGEPARLSDGSAGDSRATAVSESPTGAGGGPARLSGGNTGDSRATDSTTVSKCPAPSQRRARQPVRRGGR